MNPSYDAEKLGLDMIGTEEPDMSYEFNELLFWRRRDNGQVFFATDSGCSCPTPFEGCEGATTDEVCQKLERIGSLEQAERCFDAWNKPEWRGGSCVDQATRSNVLKVVAEWLALPTPPKHVTKEEG